MNKKSTSDAKVSANRRNAKKSVGPNDTSSTRFNAVKHGLLSAGVTEIDDAGDFRETLRRLGVAYLEELDDFLVERIALYMVRLRRTARLEAEFIRSVLHPPVYGASPLDLPTFEAPMIDPGLPPSMGGKAVEELNRSYLRYESANENKLYRALNQLERIRRIRQGEHLPAPVAVDVAVHSESPGGDSAGAVPDLVLEGSQLESTHKGNKVRTEGAGANDTSEEHPPKASESSKTTEEPD